MFGEMLLARFVARLRKELLAELAKAGGLMDQDQDDLEAGVERVIRNALLTATE